MVSTGRRVSADEAKRIADKYFRDGETVIERKDGGGEYVWRKLTAKETRFVDEYLEDFNATQAAIRAKYSAKTAYSIGHENLNKPEIIFEIQQRLKKMAATAIFTKKQVAGVLIEQLFADVNDIFDANGALKPVNQLPLIWRTGMITQIETETRRDPLTEGETITVTKLKFGDRLKRLELLGKHVDVNAFTERKTIDLADGVKELYRQISGTGLTPVDEPKDSNPAETKPRGFQPVQNAGKA